MKKRILSTLLALALAVGLLAVPAFAEDGADDLDISSYPTVFSDVPIDFWAYWDIERAFIAGAMNGMSYDEQTGVRTFAPKGKVTVVQFLAIMVRSGFRYELWMSEVSDEGDWSAPYVAVAKEQGLLKGLEDVDLKAPITRYQMAVILSNEVDSDLSQEQFSGVWEKIADRDAIPVRYRKAVAKAYYLGIINGRADGSFDGNATMTRAEAAAVYCRMADNLVIASGELGGAACGEKEWLRTRWFLFKVVEGTTMYSWHSLVPEWHEWEPQEGYKFVVLNVSLRNYMEEAIPMSCNEFVLWWGGQPENCALPAVALTASGSYDVLGDEHIPIDFELPAGEYGGGWLVYMVPDEAEDFMLTYVEQFEDGTYGDRFYVELAMNHLVG